MSVFTRKYYRPRAEAKVPERPNAEALGIFLSREAEEQMNAMPAGRPSRVGREFDDLKIPETSRNVAEARASNKERRWRIVKDFGGFGGEGCLFRQRPSDYTGAMKELRG